MEGSGRGPRGRAGWSAVPLGTCVSQLVALAAVERLTAVECGPLRTHTSVVPRHAGRPCVLQACFPAAEPCQDGQGHFRVPQGSQPSCHQAVLVFPGSKGFQGWRRLWRYSRDFSQELGKLRESKALDQGLTRPPPSYLPPPSVPMSPAQAPGLLPRCL